jgi:phytol kinase
MGGSNLLGVVITVPLALLWLRLNDYLAHRGVISSQLSRKIIHIGTGPIFVLCWLLFPMSDPARFIAAVIPFGITLQFLLVGLGVIQDKSAVDGMSRHGDRREILRGLLYYGIVFVILTLAFWKHSPIGIIALMILCGGDGLGDVLGNRIPSGSLPWSPRKTWIGSLAVFLGSFLFSLTIVAIYAQAGVFTLNWQSFIPQLLLITAVCTIVESLPLRDFDNLTVPAASVALGLILF